jgi:hypothetical protein
VGEQRASAETAPAEFGTDVAAEIGSVAATGELAAAMPVEGLPGLTQGHCGKKTGADKVACEYMHTVSSRKSDPAWRVYQAPPQRRETRWTDNGWFKWARNRQQANNDRIVRENKNIRGLDQDGNPCINSDLYTKCDNRYVTPRQTGQGRTANGNPCTADFGNVKCYFDNAPAQAQPRANNAPAVPQIRIGGGGSGGKRACGPLNAKLTGCKQNVN